MSLTAFRRTGQSRAMTNPDTRPETPARIRDLAPRYDAILCDVWGVIRDGRSLLPEAIEALQRFRAGGGRVVLVSNSPRRPSGLLSQLSEMGAPDDAWDDAVTSGGATHEVLKARAPGPAFKLGPDWDDSIYDGTGLEFAPLDQARVISNTGLFDWESETPEDYDDLLSRARERGLEMVCANPDRVVQFGDRLLYCAGALAEAYEAMGGEVIYAGKPHAPVYDSAKAKLDALGVGWDRERLLAIGDGPETDVGGANAQGIDALFITGGILGGDFRDGLDADAVAKTLARREVRARYAAKALEW